MSAVSDVASESIGLCWADLVSPAKRRKDRDGEILKALFLEAWDVLHGDDSELVELSGSELAAGLDVEPIEVYVLVWAGLFRVGGRGRVRNFMPTMLGHVAAASAGVIGPVELEEPLPDLDEEELVDFLGFLEDVLMEPRWLGEVRDLVRRAGFASSNEWIGGAVKVLKARGLLVDVPRHGSRPLIGFSGEGRDRAEAEAERLGLIGPEDGA